MMGVITDMIKQRVLQQFEIQKDKSDVLQQIDSDGLGFKIKRSNGATVVYDGTAYKKINGGR